MERVIQIPNFDVGNTKVWYLDEDGKIQSGYISKIQYLLDDDETTFSIDCEEFETDDIYLSLLDAKKAQQFYILEQEECVIKGVKYFASEFSPKRNFREETIAYPSIFTNVKYRGEKYLVGISSYYEIDFNSAYKFSDEDYLQPLISKKIEIKKQSNSKSIYVDEFKLQYLKGY